jgi:hypothetical protein
MLKNLFFSGSGLKIVVPRQKFVVPRLQKAIANKGAKKQLHTSAAWRSSFRRLTGSHYVTENSCAFMPLCGS